MAKRKRVSKEYVIMSARGAKNFMPVIDAADEKAIANKRARGWSVVGEMSMSGDFTPEYCRVTPVKK